MKKLLMAAVVACLFASPLGAQTPEEPTLTEWLEMRQKNERIADFYLGGVLHGIKNANMASKLWNKQSIYCAPNDMAITQEMGNMILTIWMRSVAPEDRLSASRFRLATAMMDALRRRYPCA